MNYPPQDNLQSAYRFAQLTGGGGDIDPYALWGKPTCGVQIGAAGALKVTQLDGTVTVLNLAAYPPGTRLDIQVRLVWDVGTTCTGVIVFAN